MKGGFQSILFGALTLGVGCFMSFYWLGVLVDVLFTHRTSGDVVRAANVKWEMVRVAVLYSQFLFFAVLCRWNPAGCASWARQWHWMVICGASFLVLFYASVRELYGLY
jgi:hypothetical protein